MANSSAEEFIQTLLATLDDLPPGFGRRLEEVLKQPHADRSQAIRELFEEFAGEPSKDVARE